MTTIFRHVRMLTNQEKEGVVAELSKHVRRCPEIVFALLHGSFLQPAGFRDIDVALYLDRESDTPVDFRHYEADVGIELEMALKLPVDLRVLNDAPLAFRYHVLKGRPLLVRNLELFDDFRERTWDSYIDFAPFARNYLREAIGE